MTSARRRMALVGTTAVIVLLGGACAAQGSSSAAAASTGPASNGSAASCPARDLPAGFRLDAAHSGSMDPSQYSESGDMQAAMIYDGYQGGVRAVYTNLGPGPVATTDLVVECIIMQFQQSSGAAAFIAAYQALRQQAGSLAQEQTPIGKVGATTLQYSETGQAFSGYQISSTDVVEMASEDAGRFYSVVVAGPHPSPELALTLLRDLVASP